MVIRRDCGGRLNVAPWRLYFDADWDQLKCTMCVRSQVGTDARRLVWEYISEGIVGGRGWLLVGRWAPLGGHEGLPPPLPIACLSASM